MTEPATQDVLSAPLPPEEGDCELRYLLSAYLFGSLSEEGRLEVEKQLESSESCRAELEELKETLSLLTDSLCQPSAPGSEYSFETKRMDRVLAASRKRGHSSYFPAPPGSPRQPRSCSSSGSRSHW